MAWCRPNIFIFFLLKFFNYWLFYGALLRLSTMNYCMTDMYEMPHSGMGGYTVPGGGEHCMYAGEGPWYGHCEPQPLHHPPCVQQAWPPSQPPNYSCAYAGGPPVFKSEFCSMEVPLSHFHHQPEYFSEIKPDISHWMHKKGTASGWWFCAGFFGRAELINVCVLNWLIKMLSRVLWWTVWILGEKHVPFF